jgi:hypothetical protein
MLILKLTSPEGGLIVTSWPRLGDIWQADETNDRGHDPVGHL